MTSPKGDPTFIDKKDHYFMAVACTIAEASTHPKMKGGCVIVRDREIIGDGRSILTHTKIEVDPISYAVASAAKNGSQTLGAVIYSTRYPFSASVFQAHVMGIRRVVVLAHEWEPYFREEFRRAARLARELSVSLEALFVDQDKRFSRSMFDRDDIDPELFPDATFDQQEYDPADQYQSYNADQNGVGSGSHRPLKAAKQDPLHRAEGSGDK